MSEIDLQDKFPELTPIKRPPTLWTINSIGISIYGRRDFDQETFTYVKTRALCLLFIPVFFIDAYRVADAGGEGWYFVGRVPMSVMAKVWNSILIAAIVVGVGAGYLNSYMNSPSMVAKRQLGEADTAAQAGEFAQAAGLYLQVASSGTKHEAVAEERLWELLNEPSLGANAAEEAPQVLTTVIQLHKRRGSEETGKQIVDRGLALAAVIASTNASRADRILDSIASLADEDERFHVARRGVLEQIVQQEPGNVTAVSKLAVAYEALGESDACEKLLAPLKDQLGVFEGARILGQILAARGEFDEAHALLVPYCEQHLTALHNAEKQLDNAYKAAQQRAIARLEAGQGPPSFYTDYENADEAEQDRMVQEYLTVQLRGDTGIETAQEALMAQADVVPVALDLGVVLLRRAQEMTDPARRQAELEQAEKTFIAIRGLAGESDQYRIYLGQVNYWLGKHDEGHQLFEEVLATNNRSAEMLIAIAGMLREVGLSEEARARAEEAYENGATPQEKYSAARMRAANYEDVDDQVEWLQKSDPNDAGTKAALAGALGDRAMVNGDYQEAEKQERAAVAAYAQLPENVSTLNNGALAHFALFTLTGDRTHFDQGTEMLERAISLSPSDSVLLANAAETIYSGAVAELLSSAIDLRVLTLGGQPEMLEHLYEDEAGWRQMQAAFKEHPGVAKALDFHRRELVLAPKRVRSYRQLAQLLVLSEDLAGLQAMLEQIRQAQPDTSADLKKRLEFYRGEKDDERAKDMDRGTIRITGLVEAARSSELPATFAVAVDYLVDLHYSEYALRPVENVDELVALSDEAVKAHASTASRANLAHALLLRACHTLEASDPDFATYAAQTKRGVDPGRMIAFLACRGGSLADRVAQNADVQRAVEIVAENGKRFPNKATAWRWALLRNWRSDDAVALTKTLQADRVYEIEREIDLLLNPASTTLALDQYWTHLLAGEEEQGKALLRACAEQGAPVPDFE